MSKKHPLRPYIPLIIGGLALVGAIAGVLYLISTFKPDAPKKEHKVQVISLTKPPPPPPPPPKVEKLPEPKEEKLREAKPEPKPDAPPKADNNAKPESVGSGKGNMATDLGGGEVTRPVAGPQGGGGNDVDNKRNADFYGHQVVRELEELFSDDEDLLSLQFRVVVKLWFERDGSIQRVDLVKGSGDAEADKEVQRKLGKVRRFSEAPPEGVVSPIKIEFAVGN